MSNQLSEASDFIFNAAKERFGVENVYVAASHKERQFGIELPSLALQYLFACNIWPLQRITQLQGQQYTCKSAFIYELHRWFLEAGGLVIHIDTENKTSSTLPESIIGPKLFYGEDGDINKCIQMLNADSVNQWQQQVTLTLESLKNYAKSSVKAPKGCEYLQKPDFPIIISVDSMMGLGSKESQKYVEKTGEGQGRTFSEAPLLIANYMRDITGRLLGWPVNIHFSHHELVDTATQAPRHAGGRAVDFRATYDLRFVKGAKVMKEDGSYSGNKKYYDGVGSRKGYEGYYICISPTKNSEGPNKGRFINVPFIWTRDEVEDDPSAFHQTSLWDWNTSLTDLLLRTRKGIKDILNIQDGTRNRAKAYWASELGQKPEDALEPHEFGALVEETKPVRDALASFYNVQTLRVFSPDQWPEVYADELNQRMQSKKGRKK